MKFRKVEARPCSQGCQELGFESNSVVLESELLAVIMNQYE